MHTKIVYAARNLHDEICQPFFREAQDVFDHPTPFDPSNDVFDDHTHTRNEVIEEPFAYTPFLACGFF